MTDTEKIACPVCKTIGMIEAGKFNPSLQLCIAICRALDRTLDGLFWEDEEREE